MNANKQTKSEIHEESIKYSTHTVAQAYACAYIKSDDVWLSAV